MAGTAGRSGAVVFTGQHAGCGGASQGAGSAFPHGAALELTGRGGGGPARTGVPPPTWEAACAPHPPWAPGAGRPPSLPPPGGEERPGPVSGDPERMLTSRHRPGPAGPEQDRLLASPAPTPLLQKTISFRSR